MAIGRHVGRRLILRDTVQSAEIRALAEVEGWSYVGDIKRDPDNQVFYEAKWELPGEVSVHYVADEFVDERYLVVAGEDDSRVEDVSNRVASALDVWTLDELLRSFDVSVYPVGEARAVLRLGAGSPQRAVDAVMTRVLEAVHNEEATVRRAALWAMVYAAWPEYQESLVELAAQDPDPETAREAQLALQLMRDEGVIEP